MPSYPVFTDPSTPPPLPAAWLNRISFTILCSGAGDGTTDDTAAIVADLARCSAAGGGVVRLEGGKTYRVTSKITIPSSCGLVSDGTGRLFAPAATFDNKDPGNRYGSNAAVLDFSGQITGSLVPSDGIILHNFIIESEVADGRLVDAIVGINAQVPSITNIEIFGFPVAVGIRASCIQGGRISRNYIHDFHDNADWSKAAGYSPQITGIIEGAAGKYGWRDTSTLGGNFAEGMSIMTGAANAKRIDITSGGGACRLAGSGVYHTSLI
jgi:hypothetical protein